MSGKLKEARQAWDAATRAWSRDDCADVTKTMKLGEAMMFAATDLICAMEHALAQGQTLSDVLSVYGFPVSDEAWRKSSGSMSFQARGLHLAASEFRKTIKSEAA